MSDHDAALDELLRGRVALERLRAAWRLHQALVETLNLVIAADADPTLLPEIGNAGAHLSEAAASLDRALEVLQVRAEIVRDRLDADRREGL